MAKADEKNSAEYARQKAAGYLLSPETRRVIDEKTRLLDNAEKGIQAILLALENDHGKLRLPDQFQVIALSNLSRCEVSQFDVRVNGFAVRGNSVGCQREPEGETSWSAG